MSNLLARRRVIAAKEESAPGTPEAANTFVEDDANMKVFDYSYSQNLDVEERNPYSEHMGGDKDVVGNQSAAMSMEFELVGSGNHVTTPPPWDRYLRACGMKRELHYVVAISSISGIFQCGELITGVGGVTFNAGKTAHADGLFAYYAPSAALQAGTITGNDSGATATIAADGALVGYRYSPSSSEADHAALTVREYNDGLMKAIAGARGTFGISASGGKPIRLPLEFQGKLLDPEDATQLGSNKNNLNPQTFRDVGLFVDMDNSGSPYVPKFESISIELGNEIELPIDANDTSGAGYAEAVISDRKPTGTIEVYASTVGEHDWFGHMKNVRSGPMTFAVGSTAGNRFVIHAPNAQYTNSSEGDKAGRVTYSMSMKFNPLSGSDELIIFAE